MAADLLTHVDGAEVPADALSESQVWGLQQGVEAAIEDGDDSLAAPSAALSAGRWHHWGIGISVWIHESGVVVLQKDGGTIVTDISMLDHVSAVLAGAHARIGCVTRIDPDGGED